MGAKRFYIQAIFLFFILTLTIHFVGGEARAKVSLKAEPSSAELNPKALAVVQIIGSGFKAQDRVMISLTGGKKGIDVPVASAEADDSGSFQTRMNILSILQGVCNFRFKKGRPTPDPNNPPSPPGNYVLKAYSWDSKLETSCDFVIKPPQKK